MQNESEVINIRDFMNHETRISLVENAVLNIDKRFDHVEKSLSEIRAEGLTYFRWMMGSILGLYGVVLTALIALVLKLA